MLAIVGGRALLGEELEAMDDAVLLVRAGRVAAAGPRREVVVPPGAHRVDAAGLTLLPGVIDAHVHIGFYDPAEVLRGGVTAARDLGWPPERIWPLVRQSRDPGFEGPELWAAGQILTAPGGYPTRAAWAPARTGLELAGPRDAKPAVAAQAGQGACVIKVALHPPGGPVLDRATLAAVVAAAHRRGLRVTAHLWGAAELETALACGVDELAHLPLSPEPVPPRLLQAAARAGVAVVPTLSVFPAGERAAAVAALGTFVRAGGTVIYGTDLGNEGPRPGIDPTEVAAMHDAGMDGRDIVASATALAARSLGLRRKGVLVAGRDADIVGVAGDPLSHPAHLTRVALVVRAGRVVVPA